MVAASARRAATCCSQAADSSGSPARALRCSGIGGALLALLVEAAMVITPVPVPVLRPVFIPVRTCPSIEYMFYCFMSDGVCRGFLRVFLEMWQPGCTPLLSRAQSCRREHRARGSPQFRAAPGRRCDHLSCADSLHGHGPTSSERALRRIRSGSPRVGQLANR